MNRTIIGGAILGAIAVLAGIAYFYVSLQVDRRVDRDVRARVHKSAELLVQNANLDMLKLQQSVEINAADAGFLGAFKGPFDPDQADETFRRLSSKAKADGKTAPEIFAVLDGEGRVLAQMGIVNPVTDQLLSDGKPSHRSIELALEQRFVIAEIWNYQERGLLKVGVAPIIDSDFDRVVGAVIMGYSLTASEAQRQQSLLGAEVAYFYDGRVYATSFRRAGNEDTTKQDVVAKSMAAPGIDADALANVYAKNVAMAQIDGSDYLATAGRLPRFSSRPLPPDYPGYRAGAVILKSLDEARDVVGVIRFGFGFLGVGAMILAAIGLLLVAKSFLGPLDHIEVGINDIINGNLDRTFEPVGSDFEGMANALNVMMARLLGRPEPGDEDYDEDGNIITPSVLHFDTEDLTTRETEAMALSQEPATDYYQRIFDEYIAARKHNGDTVEGITFDGFVAKLHLNEAALKRKHECQQVRFRVATKDGKVILKPVPIA